MLLGYKGQAGKEYFNTEFSGPVENGNIIEFVEKIETAIATCEELTEEI